MLIQKSSLSPGGEMMWMKDNKTLDADMISNPFIEKSDIVNHRRKIRAIDMKREMI